MTPPGAFTTVVVPCFNEEHRIAERDFLQIARLPRMRLLFVDDGSTDATGTILERIADSSESVEVFALDSNLGKAEAVRRGLLVAVRKGASVVGYYDADLATPPSELLRLARTMDAHSDLAAVLGCRVARMGSSIKRSLTRHYVGRIYATLASLALGTTVYDTQCGAKLFRVTPSLIAALAEPFRSAWSFDVELLGRLLQGTGNAPPVGATSFLEVPLDSWRDVDGSKMSFGQAFQAFMDLASMARSRPRPSARVHPSALSGRATSSVPSVLVPPSGETTVVVASDVAATEGDDDAVG